MLEELGIGNTALIVAIIAAIVAGIFVYLTMKVRIREIYLNHQEDMATLRKKKETGLKAQLKGDLAELCIPWMSESGCSGTELRHFGKPIDWIGFRGLDDPDKDVSIRFIEVKTGKAKTLTKNERRIKQAVERKDVDWVTVHINREDVEKYLARVGIQ